jgi:hypothetical protein
MGFLHRRIVINREQSNGVCAVAITAIYTIA